MSSSHPFWSEACISKEHWAGEFMQAGTLGRRAAEGWRAFLGPLSMVVGQRKLLQCLCTVPSTPSSKRACQPPLIDRWVFSAGSALLLQLHKDEPLFFLSPVISVPPLSLNASFHLAIGWKVGKPGSPFLLVPLRLWFLTYWTISHLALAPIAGFLLLFLFLLFALRIREKIIFSIFIFAMGLGSGQKLIFQCVFLDAQRTSALRDLWNLLLRLSACWDRTCGVFRLEINTKLLRFRKILS